MDCSISRLILTKKLSHLLSTLEEETKKSTHNLEFIVFSDTIVIFAQSVEATAYPWFLSLCKSMANKSIYQELPLQGAISVGTTFTSENPTIIMGTAFVEAYEYCEDQNWIGLLLTPSATKELTHCKLNPLHHDFVQSSKIPMKTKSIDGVWAYRYQNGCANFSSPLFPKLRQMQKKAPEQAFIKYENTISFITQHYSFC